MAPFQVILLPLNGHKSHRVKDTAERLYQQLQAAGVDVLMDDRPQRPGVMFADAELIGIPHGVVISDRGLDQGTVEYRPRGGEQLEMPLEAIADHLIQRLSNV